MSNAMINVCDETLELRLQMDTEWGDTHSEKYSHTLIYFFTHSLTHSQRISGRRHLNNNNGIEKETISNDIAKCWVHRQLALAYSVKSELIWSTVTTTKTTQAAGQGRARQGRAQWFSSCAMSPVGCPLFSSYCRCWAIISWSTSLSLLFTFLLWPDALLLLLLLFGRVDMWEKNWGQVDVLCPPVAFLPSDETAHCLAAHSIHLFLYLSPLVLIISQKKKKTPAAFCRAWHMVTKHAKKKHPRLRPIKFSICFFYELLLAGVFWFQR